MRPAPASASSPTSMSPSPAAPPPAGTPTASPWHSPVPYLFGGLAAMLGLISLALLILACSYWKVNSYLGDASSSSADPDATAGDGSKSPAVAATTSPAALADLVAVVMAGEKTPTFLATPVVHRTVDDDTGEDSTAEEKSGKAGAGDGGGGGALVDDVERDRQGDRVRVIC